MVSRRRLLQMTGGAALLGPLGGVQRALAATAEDRHFLFILAYGGWDPAYLMASPFGHSAVHHPDGATYDATAPLPFVDLEKHSATREFLLKYGHLGCFLNGLEVPSIAHEQCRKLIMTGYSDGQQDDFLAILGGHATGFDLPNVVVTGPAYGHRYASSQLRLGPDGQLGKLVSGDALLDSDIPVGGVTQASHDDVQAYLEGRRARYAEGARAGAPHFVDALLHSEDQLASLASLSGDIELDIDVDGYAYLHEQAVPALELMERGLTRCASLVHLGEFNAGWDTHVGIDKQGTHFETLCSDLMAVFDSLAERGLLDSTTIVVASEMGRTPILNPVGGKDHWTFTSAMLFGSGIVGGQVLGGFDDDWIGEPLDGRIVTTLDLGATLLQLGGLDPAEHLPRGIPITQMLA